MLEQSGRNPSRSIFFTGDAKRYRRPLYPAYSSIDSSLLGMDFKARRVQLKVQRCVEIVRRRVGHWSVLNNLETDRRI